MTRTIATIAGVAAVATAANAQFIMTHTFDISGLSVDGGFGANFLVNSLVHDFGSAGTVIGVEWDVNFTAFGASWQNEAEIAVDTNDDTSIDADVDPGDFGAAAAPGFFAYSGAIGAATPSSDGIVYLTLYDSFNDAGIDHTYGAGSFVTVTFDAVVPTPATAGLLGLGGLVAARRRRA